LARFLIFRRSQRQVERGVVGRARNLVQGIGHGTDEILHPVTRNGRDGLKFEAALLAELAQGYEARAIRSGVEFWSRTTIMGFSVSDSLKAASSPLNDFKRSGPGHLHSNRSCQ